MTVKRLLGEPDHDVRVLAERPQHCDLVEAVIGLAQDIDALAFEPGKMIHDEPSDNRILSPIQSKKSFRSERPRVIFALDLHISAEFFRVTRSVIRRHGFDRAPAAVLDAFSLKEAEVRPRDRASEPDAPGIACAAPAGRLRSASRASHQAEFAPRPSQQARH